MSDIQPVDRRRFIVRAGVGAAAMTAAALLPASLLQASEACALQGAPQYPDPCGDWTLDDICNAYPPYNFDVRAGMPHHAPLEVEMAPADRMWVA